MGDIALLLLRVALGTIFIVHGREKRKFWKMQASPQLPAGMLRTLRLLSIAEPAGGLAVLVGFLTRPAALGLSLVMLGALRLLIVQLHKRFSEHNAPGWEFEFLMLMVAVTLALVGGGRFALDRVLFGF